MYCIIAQKVFFRFFVAYRETVESIVVARREDVGTIEMEVVRVRSIRIGSS